jgi:hypothetical protein
MADQDQRNTQTYSLPPSNTETALHRYGFGGDDGTIVLASGPMAALANRFLVSF